jgi:REP element-mobilizing transposase RayT
MAENKYLGLYRNGTNRLKKWDYNSSGAYFVTIVAHARVHFFGSVVDGEMNLTTAGQIAMDIWFEIPKHYAFAKLGAFVVMPDHVHAIIIIDKSGNTQNANKENSSSHCDSNNKNADTEILEGRGGVTGKHNPMFHESVGRVVRWYKGRTTFECGKAGVPIKWQRLYYDSIIRDETAYTAITHYIKQNPANWKKK